MIDARTDRHTHRQTQATTIPEGQYWPRVKIDCIFQCMGKIFCVEFQRFPLKFHTKYLTHTLKDVHFIRKLLDLRARKCL